VIGLFVARQPAILTVRKRRLSKSSKWRYGRIGGRAHWVALESANQESSNVAANMAERLLCVRGKGEEEEEKEEGATVSVKELQSFTNTDIQSHAAYDKCSSDGVLGSFHNLLGCRS
jgi:hypothetical protein